MMDAFAPLDLVALGYLRAGMEIATGTEWTLHLYDFTPLSYEADQWKQGLKYSNHAASDAPPSSNTWGEC
jgi:hypothetical protein